MRGELTRKQYNGCRLGKCTYDLRFPSDLDTSRQMQRPYNQFHSYQNIKLGHLAAAFDVHGDLAAAITDDGRIMIRDIKGGVELKQSRWKGPRIIGHGRRGDE